MHTLVANHQLWAGIIGSLVPLVTYVVNHVAPWTSEPAKAFVLVLTAAVAGGLYTALSSSTFGLNTATLELVLTSVVGALAAHHGLWKPATISARLGAGSNASEHPRHRLVWQKEPEPPPAPAPPAA